jgi:hypothetical protein
VFLTLPVLIALTRSVPLLAASLIAPAAYYGYGALAGSLIRDQMRMRFEPHLIPTSFFWGGLARMASRVETLPLLAVTVIAAATARDRAARLVLAALLAGYLAFAIAFTYHMPTHDYYHLPYIAVVSLGAAVLFARIGARVPVIVVYGLCAAIAVGGTLAAWPRMRVDDAQRLAQTYVEIGELTGHTTHALFLDTEYGYALMYHAQMSGDSWPNRDDLAAETIDGRPPLDADARYLRDYSEWGPAYFVVTDLGSLDASPDLQAMLAGRATPIRKTDRYQVYRFNR